MDARDIKLRKSNWLTYQLIFPLIPLLIDFFIRVLMAGDSYFDFFKSQKLTLIAFIVFLNMTANLIIDKEFIRNRKRDISDISTIKFNVFITLATVLIILYPVLLMYGYILVDPNDFKLQNTFIIFSISLYLSFILLAYLLFIYMLVAIKNVNQ